MPRLLRAVRGFLWFGDVLGVEKWERVGGYWIAAVLAFELQVLSLIYWDVKLALGMCSNELLRKAWWTNKSTFRVAFLVSQMRLQDVVSWHLCMYIYSISGLAYHQPLHKTFGGKSLACHRFPTYFVNALPSIQTHPTHQSKSHSSPFRFEIWCCTKIAHLVSRIEVPSSWAIPCIVSYSEHVLTAAWNCLSRHAFRLVVRWSSLHTAMTNVSCIASQQPAPRNNQTVFSVTNLLQTNTSASM